MDRLNLKHLARLARLQLDPAQEEGLSRDMERILAFFQSLE
ncbi:MAG TPA: Asp-tRNA(Asn)/Glu-tRNA(Gln) amidotransferase GatCAB subunit C, partial [Planctomycetes bacterium]|nr:Asp-tRNA(Asn)/Glu-tRNA(Gln) amidotransferase GatCAB subunit C [Planctomycetota bacterium]